MSKDLDSLTVVVEADAVIAETQPQFRRGSISVSASHHRIFRAGAVDGYREIEYTIDQA
jgi:hypothetical protein